jgi:hypothetical protein
MKRKYMINTIIVLSLISLLVLILLFIVFPVAGNTTLTVTVLDAVSNSWVYNSYITIQNRVIRGFKSTTFTFHNLKTGKHLLSVSAPHYDSEEVEVSIHSGNNILKEPVELTGYEIPDLDDIALFEGKKDDTMQLDFRLVRRDGHAVTNHPCLPITIYCQISEQRDDEAAPQRGETLYADSVKWAWNTALTETYRYTAGIPLRDITKIEVPYWMVDYLILFPDPRKIQEKNIEGIVEKARELQDINAIAAYLDTYKGRLRWFFRSHTDVENMFGGNGN